MYCPGLEKEKKYQYVTLPSNYAPESLSPLLFPLDKVRAGMRPFGAGVAPLPE
jgi:hypothetical protein